MSDSFPTFVANKDGHITVIFSNFSGELTVKDIIKLTKYVDCPIPPKDLSPRADHISSKSEGPVEGKFDAKPANFNDTSTIAEKEESEGDDSVGSANLLEASDESENLNGKKDLSVAFDDDIECEFGLSQQVQGRNGRYWLR